MDDKYIFVWPDASWCYADELEEVLQYKSDDYFRLDTTLYPDENRDMLAMHASLGLMGESC